MLRISQQHAFPGMAVLRRNMQKSLRTALALDFSDWRQLGEIVHRHSWSDALQIDSAVFAGANCARHV